MKKQNIFLYYFLYFTFVWVILFGAMSVHSPSAIAEIPKETTQSSPKELELQRLSGKKFTADQITVLMIAYDMSTRDGLQPELMQGILIQESKAGDAPLKKSGSYHGVAQLQLGAAKDVLRRYPELLVEFDKKTPSDRTIISRLRNDDEFNISIASKYLLMIREMGYNTLQQMAMAYNIGPYGARNKNALSHGYAKKVMVNANIIKRE